MSLDFYLKDPTATYNVKDLFERNITHNLNKMAKECNLYSALWRPWRLHTDFKNKWINLKTDRFGNNSEYRFASITKMYSYDIVEYVKDGLIKLKEDPEYFKTFNAPNGYGTYDNFVKFVEDCYKALLDYPNALVYTSI